MNETKETSTSQRMFHLLLEVLDPLCLLTPEQLQEPPPSGDPTQGPDDLTTSTSALAEVSEAQRDEALRTWSALNDLFDAISVQVISACEQRSNGSLTGK